MKGTESWVAPSGLPADVQHGQSLPGGRHVLRGEEANGDPETGCEGDHKDSSEFA